MSRPPRFLPLAVFGEIDYWNCTLETRHKWRAIYENDLPENEFMLEPETPLPLGWVDVLDEIHRRLDHSIAAADARIREAPTFDAQPMVAQRNAEIAQWNDRLERMSAFIESSDASVRAIDDALAAEETRARQDVERCKRLQQRLADCTRGAIG